MSELADRALLALVRVHDAVYLTANPAVEINVGPRRFAVTARPVSPDDPEYPR